MTPLRYGMIPLKLTRSKVGTIVYLGGGWGGNVLLIEQHVCFRTSKEWIHVYTNFNWYQSKWGAHAFQRPNCQCTRYLLSNMIKGRNICLTPSCVWILAQYKLWGITKHIIHGRGTCVRKIGQAKTAILCEETCQARNITNTKTAVLHNSCAFTRILM